MKIEGCLLALASFITGGTVVAVGDYFYARDRHYLDRTQATPLARTQAREACLVLRNDKTIDCSHWETLRIDEASDGWHFVFRSGDGRQKQGVWVGRLGEVDDDGIDVRDEPKASAE